MMLKLTIPGQPIPLARPRFYRGGVIDTQSSQKRGIRKLITSQLSKLGMGGCSGECPLNMPKSPQDCTIMVDLGFGMAYPKNASKARKNAFSENGEREYHGFKPDLDNLIKFILDCGNGLLWVDDAQISHLTAVKYFDQKPHTTIRLQKVSCNDVPELI